VNTFTGQTFVNAGTLQLGVAGALPFANVSSGFYGTTLTIAGGASVVASHLATPSAVQLTALNNSGLIDLNNNGLDLNSQNASLQTIWSQLQTGYNGGGWNGTSGIISTDAANNPKHLTTLGVILNDNGMGTNTPLYTTFEGVTPQDGDVLVKYTYYGDTNLDGKVDGTDYSRIDAGYLSGGTGWYNGDFNYDGVIDGSDYTLIDNAFNTQGATLSAEVASPTAQVAGDSSAVPEPASLGLLAIGAAGLLGRRRRK
jgi:PEP-CTERM motif